MKGIRSRKTGVGGLAAVMAIWLCGATANATGMLYEFGNVTSASPVAQPAIDPPPIDGSIVFSGAATLNAPLPSATSFTSIFGVGSNPDPSVVGESGDYNSVTLGTQATFTPFTFIPAATDFTLWSFMFGGATYSFEATTGMSVFENANFLNISGNGIASITGFADTSGTWSITSTGAGASPTFSFGAGSVAVPEPSTFALLIFLAPLCWILLRRPSTKQA